MKTCPLCTAPLAKGKLLCSSHWARVPAHLQAEVRRTFGRMKQATRPESVAATLANYRAAKAAAIEAARA